MEKEEYPQCTKCGHAMVWSFAIPYKEYVCAPCGRGLPMFNSAPKLMRSGRYMNRKKKKWERDLHAITVSSGSGQCISERNGEPCPLGICPPDSYEYQYWRKRAV